VRPGLSGRSRSGTSEAWCAFDWSQDLLLRAGSGEKPHAVTTRNWRGMSCQRGSLPWGNDAPARRRLSEWRRRGDGRKSAALACGGRIRKRSGAAGEAGGSGGENRSVSPQATRIGSAVGGGRPFPGWCSEPRSLRSRRPVQNHPQAGRGCSGRGPKDRRHPPSRSSGLRGSLLGPTMPAWRRPWPRRSEKGSRRT